MASLPGPIARAAAGWRRHPVLWTLFSLALVLTVLFGVRSTLHAIYWADPAHRDRAIEGWMTPNYVARSWDVPPEVLRNALGQRADLDGARRTLERIARASDVPLAEVVAQLEAAIAAHRAAAP